MCFTHLVLCVGDGVLADELELGELQQFIRIGNALEDGAQVLKRLVVADGHESSKGISLAGSVALGLEERLQQLGGVGHESLVVLEDGGNGEDGVLADI